MYPKLDYCVQYNETDFDFVHRLLEEFGIYYFFEHEESRTRSSSSTRWPQHEPHPADATRSTGAPR